jgi:hypothetical protein
MRTAPLVSIVFIELNLVNCSTDQTAARHVAYSVPKSPVDLVKQYNRDVDCSSATVREFQQSSMFAQTFYTVAGFKEF